MQDGTPAEADGYRAHARTSLRFPCASNSLRACVRTRVRASELEREIERERERERDDGTYLDEKLVLNIFFDRVAIKVRACARGRRKERRFGRHVMEPGVP